jgi:hypothetical protein
MACVYEINLPNGSGTLCGLEKGMNCVAVDSNLRQEDCDCFVEAEILGKNGAE